MREHASSKHVVCCTVAAASSEEEPQNQRASHPSTKSSEVKETALGLLAEHAYCVMGCVLVSETRFVQLRESLGARSSRLSANSTRGVFSHHQSGWRT